ncbi:MAG: DRTGG domain-containing protein [Armatimonadota bacterium]
MSIDDIRKILRADVLCGEDKLCILINNACGCDLMSDVLAFTRPGALLLTGLTNSQVVRTAEILDLKCIVFVRDKRPDAATIQMAKENGIPVLSTPYPLFESCGLLFAKGLRGCMQVG